MVMYMKVLDGEKGGLTRLIIIQKASEFVSSVLLRVSYNTWLYIKRKINRFCGFILASKPNAAALQAVKDLIACGVSQGKIKGDYKLVAHRQVRQTECPGKALYDEVKTWPQWTSQP